MSIRDDMRYEQNELRANAPIEIADDLDRVASALERIATCMERGLSLAMRMVSGE